MLFGGLNAIESSEELYSELQMDRLLKSDVESLSRSPLSPVSRHRLRRIRHSEACAQPPGKQGWRSSSQRGVYAGGDTRDGGVAS